MHRHLTNTLGGIAAALMASGLSHEAMAMQAVLAICPDSAPFEAAHRLRIDSTAEPARSLVVVDAQTVLPSDCRRSAPLAFAAEAVRWLGVLPRASANSGRLAVTMRDGDGEVIGIEDDAVKPPHRSRDLPAREPVKGATLPKAPSAWIWEPESWRASPDGLIAAATQAHIAAIYITVPIADGAVEQADRLAAFIARCRAAGIEVYAVEGDPKMITDDGLPEAAARAQALADYSRAHPQAALAGVQYDIEPYLLPAFGAAPKAGWQRWSKALHALSGAYGQPVDAVVPFWIGDSPGGEDALAAARPALRALTVMAYRTTQQQIMEAAAPALLFGERTRLPVTVGLESGPIARENRHVYMPAEAGELHLATLDDVSAALLLDKPRATGEIRAFAKSHTVPSDPARVSFLGQTERLYGVADALSKTLTAYPAAERIAFHGLSAFASPAKLSLGQ